MAFKGILKRAPLPLLPFIHIFLNMPRAAWKGPFFVAFPGLKQAVQAGTPIATQGKAKKKMLETLFFLTSIHSS